MGWAHDKQYDGTPVRALWDAAKRYCDSDLNESDARANELVKVAFAYALISEGGELLGIVKDIIENAMNPGNIND